MWLHVTVTVSFVGSSVDAAAFVRSMMSCTVESTAALRAPSRAAFAVLFHEWNANPKSMIAKTRQKKRVATMANSTAAAPRSPWIRPRREPACAGGVPPSSGSADPGALGCAVSSSSVPNG